MKSELFLKTSSTIDEIELFLVQHTASPRKSWISSSITTSNTAWQRAGGISSSLHNMEKRTHKAFPFSEESEWIWVACDFANKIIERLKPEGQKLAALQQARDAIECLPEVTPGVNITFRDSLKAGDESFREQRYYEVLITDEIFQIQSGGYVYDAEVGSVTLPGHLFYSEVSGFVSSNGYIFAWWRKQLVF